MTVVYYCNTQPTWPYTILDVKPIKIKQLVSSADHIYINAPSYPMGANIWILECQRPNMEA